MMGTGLNFDPTVQVFAYTPCFLQAQSATRMYGQLYGGTVRFAPFRMAYQPIGSVPGYTPVLVGAARRVIPVSQREVSP
jgi:hypothetical protein